MRHAKAPTLRRRSLLAGLVLAGAGGVARSQSVTLQVTAIVQRHAAIRVGRMPAQLVIRQDDVERGWVRTEAIPVEVRANHQDAVALQFQCMGGAVAETDIAISDASAPIRSRGEAVSLGHLRPNTPMELQVTFRLREGVEAGAYPWPLRIALQA